MKKARKKRRSAAQKAATKRMLAALHKKRGKAPSRKKSRRRRAKSLLSREGRHRPVVIVKKRRLSRPKRSTIPARASFKNPFLGELAMIGNPHRKRRKSRKSHRRSHRRSSRGIRLNPGGALSAVLAGPREMVTADFAKDAASIAVGFVLPDMVLTKLPVNLWNSRPKFYASKIAVVAGVAAASSLVSKRAAKLVLLGGGVSILLNAWADFIAPAIGQVTAPASTGTYYGNSAGTGVYYGQSDSGMGVYYGESVGSLAESFA